MLIATEAPQTENDSAQTIAQAIRTCYESRGFGQDELAARSGIPQQTISRLAKGESKPKFWHLAAIEEACDRPRGWVLIQAGIVAGVTTVAEAIAVAPELDDVQRRVLMNVYRQFKSS